MKTKLIILAGMLLFFSCEENKENMLGCTDNSSLNYSSLADSDDGSCTYSKATFYAKYSTFLGIPITRIDITINGESIGSINGGFTWPNGPGNCSSTGTVSYQFTNSNTVDWNATIYLANGNLLSSSGIKSPSRFSECLKINVTN